MSIRDVAARDEDSALWTLEEISRLVSASGNASETLNNIVHLIQRRFETDVCSVYLLEPDRANLVLAATVGLRPESVGRVRMRLTEGLAGLVAERLRRSSSPTRRRIPGSSTFPEAGEDPYRSFLGVPIVERGLLQGVLVVQTIEARIVRRRRHAPADDGGRAAGADRHRGAHPGAVRRARAPAARGPGRRISGGAGTRTRRASFASSIRSCGARSTTTPSPCCSRSPSTSSRSGPRSSPCTAASTTPIAGCRSICTRRAPGARAMPASSGRVRSRTSPRSSASTSRCRSTRAVSASSPAITSRARRISGVPLVGVGLYLRPGLLPAAARSRRMAARGLHRRRSPLAPDSAGAQRGRAGDRSRSRPAPGRSPRASGSSRSAATRCSSSIRTSTAINPRIGS